MVRAIRNGKKYNSFKMGFWHFKRICLEPFTLFQWIRASGHIFTLATKLLSQKHNMSTATNGMGISELALNAKNTDNKPVDQT